MEKRKENKVFGYKVFNPNWTCRDFQYRVGETYEEYGSPILCRRGFHFCTELVDCFNYYVFDPNNKVAKVVALGEIDEEIGNSKCCTNKIKILEEISWGDVLKMVNSGKGNTGRTNSGDFNTGNYNSGKYNAGNHNSGYCNTGNLNIGHYNTGNHNSGKRNTGDYNSGKYNSGHRNSGDRNSGNYNTGDWNSGIYNTGDHNCGNCNTGNWNLGNYNSGRYNTGDHNIGSGNTGYWNISNYSSGCFNTEEQKIFLFNKPSDCTYEDWLNSSARFILNRMPSDINWITSKKMTDEEKERYPDYGVDGGYLKIFDEVEIREHRQSWWDSLSEKDKDIIKAIPNFDGKIFEKVTGIKV